MNPYQDKINLYFELKGTALSSIESYSRRMNAFIKFLTEQDIAVDKLTPDDIQCYILYLKREKGLSAGTINTYITSVKFFYTYILEKEWNPIKVPRMKRRTTLPIIPPRQDVWNLINATSNLKHKAFLLLLYGSGLRVSEVVQLKISDICSKTMRVRVGQAKHGTHRYSILSQTTLNVLRDYFRAYFTHSYSIDDWLFQGRKKGSHLNIKTVKNTIIKIRNKLELDQRISAHTLRHCFATHCLENGVDVVFIQQMLGHKHLKTTEKYLHMTSKSLMGIKSPADFEDGELHE
jgi:site-specific recombinase XerD